MFLSRIQRRTYEIVEKAPEGDHVSQAFDVMIIALVLINVTAVVIETVPSLASNHRYVFEWIEKIAVIIFTIELALRFWAAGTDPRYAGIRGRLRFLVTPLVIIDILALVPFYLPMVVDTDARAMQSLRMFRLLRLFKMGRYMRSMQLFARVVKDRADQLVTAMLVVIVLLVVASSLMYVVENEAQPQVFSSIPTSMWWGIATLTTVGYGDIYPITPLGRLLGALMAVLGVGMFALPAGIIGSGFAEEMTRKKSAAAKENRCPHCDGLLDAPAEVEAELKSE